MQSISLSLILVGVVFVHAQSWKAGNTADQHQVQHAIINGKTKKGEWGKLILCAHGVRVAGFRLQVQPLIDGDNSALNSIQLACADGTVTKITKGRHGKWGVWKYCEGSLKASASKHIHGFNFRSQKDQGDGDDMAGTNVKAECNEGTELDGGGLTIGSWDNDDYQKCPVKSYFCGVQTRSEGKQVGGDHTAINQIKFLCCKPKLEVMITEETVMGKTTFGRWSRVIMCRNSGQVSGFRLRIEDSMGGDDTALNGIQLLCKDGTFTNKIEGNYGVWKPWRNCDEASGLASYRYVVGFNFMSEERQYLKDDTAGDNVKMLCNNNKELDGGGPSFGTWDSKGYKKCPYESFLCGVQARIEGKQYAKDDTSLNQMRFICCKVEDEKCPIIVEPVGCFIDKRHDRTMPNEILNERDPRNHNFVGDHYIDWFNYPRYLPAFRCRCAKKAAALGYKAFGIQMYGECWSGPDAVTGYARHGSTPDCIDTKYEKMSHDLQACPVQTGIDNTNFVYRISSVDEECTVGFAPIGCFEDFMDVPRPVPNYDHNERDKTIPGWNGITIKWKNWNIYHKKMICRCAEAAKKLNHDIFSIQFWGECWTSFRNETEFDRDGVSTRCRGKDFKSCPCNSYHCVGMHQANYVYRLNI